ncbi:DUF3014 domain-containing protein [Myxococcus sp. AM009]|uniref:DUF3014 domain-containing protein n=1 Tax=unclassified Myxococcus TaxID=2648731 RepID=UPI001595F885|nr:MULTISPECIES: DUF3014 domain-containing protein [unclassified Myxococcus]NVJ01576.1 DUF3014 domain-containing protein [Myxococcus sp. AM009]NVJ18235.1 DUF3014 domain-containing protein [Myxococcus sp. AM010]
MNDPTNPTPAEVPESAPRSKGKTLAVVLGLAGLALVASYFGLRRQESRPAEVPVVPTEPAGETAAAPPTMPETSLPERDAEVRSLASQLSPEPELARWMNEKDLVRRFTAAVNNIADGSSPRTVLGFLAPTGAFQVTQVDGTTVIDPASYARYDTVARVMGSIDTQAAASVYRELKPAIDQAHAEIAPPGQTFSSSLSAAIQHLLKVPAQEGPVEVVPEGALYAYAAPELEDLSTAQKHLLRMGPQNMKLIQAKLRELKNSLGLPPVADR